MHPSRPSGGFSIIALAQVPRLPALPPGQCLSVGPMPFPIERRMRLERCATERKTDPWFLPQLYILHSEEISNAHLSLPGKSTVCILSAHLWLKSPPPVSGISVPRIVECRVSQRLLLSTSPHSSEGIRPPRERDSRPTANGSLHFQSQNPPPIAPHLRNRLYGERGSSAAFFPASSPFGRRRLKLHPPPGVFLHRSCTRGPPPLRAMVGRGSLSAFS